LSPGASADETEDVDVTSLAPDDRVAIACIRAIQSGDVAELSSLLAAHPTLANARIGDERQARSLLHIATDWPGHFPHVNAVIETLVAAGADVGARFVGAHEETPLHWAASSDDVEAIDALLDAGADIDAPGAVLGGGPPLADAVGFGQWRAAHRLVERGAVVHLFDAAGLGMLDRVEAFFAEAHATQDDLDGALWHASHGGQQHVAEFVLARGANVNWVGWGDQTALDVARQSEAAALADWLRGNGAKSAGELR
jgi:ankyrin repeat protein